MEKEQKAEASEQELGLVSDIFKTLTKTVKTFNVYPKDNPIYQKFTAELLEKFNAFFEINDELDAGIDQHTLYYKGNEVFHSEEKIDNIPLLLFADGLRQIDFHKGITPDEILDFIDILRFAPKSAASDEDDIVTLLWEKNIKNMGYATVEDTVDDTLAVEEGVVQEGEEGEYVAGTGSGDILHPQFVLQGVSSDLKIEPLTGNELYMIKSEFSEIEEKQLLSSSVELLFELLVTEKDTEVFPEMIQGLGKIIDISMKGGDIKYAFEALGRLKELSADYPIPEQNEIINAVIYKAGSPENLRILFRETANTEDIRQYLLFFDANSIPHMITILGELDDRKKRRLLCEVLSQTGKEEIDALSEGLNDERWYLVRNIAMILGMTRNAAAVKYLEKVLRHPDLRVRRETIKALVNIPSDETLGLFLSALGDEDTTVRITALKPLRRFRDPDLFQVLKEKASAENLKEKSFEEKKELLETLAVLGGERAFPLLFDLFRKKWIEKDETTEIRACAAYGLGLIGTQKAVSLLEKEAGSKKTILREACQKALKEFQKIGDSRRESS